MLQQLLCTNPAEPGCCFVRAVQSPKPGMVALPVPVTLQATPNLHMYAAIFTGFKHLHRHEASMCSSGQRMLLKQEAVHRHIMHSLLHPVSACGLQSHGLMRHVRPVLHLSPCGSVAKHPQPYTAASPTLPSIFSAMPPDDTPDAT